MELLSQITKAIRDEPNMVGIFNWNKISEMDLHDAFIIEHFDELNIDVMCKWQKFSMAIVEKYDYIISTKMHILVTNSNLAPEVFKHYVAKMDWESAQKHYKFTPELMEEFRDGLDLVICLQHQTFPEDLLLEMLDRVMEHKNWAVLRKYLTLAFTYQKNISIEFINRFLLLEVHINTSEDGSETTRPPIILVDLPVVIDHVPLTEEFINTFCIPNVNARNAVCRSQKLSNNCINQNFDQLDVRKLLKYQKNMDEPTLERCCERAVFYNSKTPTPTTSSIISGLSLIQTVNVVNVPTDTESTNIMDQTVIENVPDATPVAEEPQHAEQRFKYATILIENQVYSLELAQRIIDSFPNPKWREILWCNVFVRTLAPIGDDSYLGFSQSTVIESVMPRVNWDIIATKTELTDSQLDRVIELASTLIPWYLYIQKHTLTESQIVSLNDSGVLDALTWWRLLTTKRKVPFTHSFITKHESRKQWWNYIEKPEEFYPSCLQALDNIDTIDVTGTQLPQIRSREDIRCFLNEFVAKADWNHILHYEVLPEWFIQLFGHDQLYPKINLYWWNVGRWSTLTQKFINRNITKLDLQVILTHQIVTEEFIRDKTPFFTAENWKTIAERQNLSNEFRIEFADQLTTV